ncbi:MAG: hypothetical protein EOP52_01805 [Sphingobacteriales bacterium]|nr:MAG: hypothetical protein EOP52_01805 [Sphingobacteriales bacterium]
MKHLTVFWAAVLALLLLPLPSQEATNRREIIVSVELARDGMNPGAIGYSRSRPLTYSDFRAQPGAGNQMTVATTHTEMGFTMRTRTTGLRTEVWVTVYAGMDPELSWMRPASRRPEILRHEQIHFDLTAIWACRMKRTMEMTTFTPATLREQLTAISTNHQDSCWAEQEQYDRETQHSIHKDAQAYWENYMTAWLDAENCFP